MPELKVALSVRIGVHTGLVVVGAVGGGQRREQLALGETPNLAARLQGLAEENGLVISAASQRLVQGFFVTEDAGAARPEGLRRAGARVPGAGRERRAQSPRRQRRRQPDAAGRARSGARRCCWTAGRSVVDGQGQVVLVTGDPGIGKSRLVQAVSARIADEPHTRLEFRCSAYHTNSPLYPVIDLLPEVLGYGIEDSPAARLEKLEQFAREYGLSPTEGLPLLAALLSLPAPEGSALPPMSPERQKQRTLETLLGLVLALAARRPVLVVVEDLHWMDPTTLELLHLLIEQAPGADLFVLLTARQSFQPQWAQHSHIATLTLNRFTHRQTMSMVAAAGGQAAAARGGAADRVQDRRRTAVRRGAHAHGAGVGPAPRTRGPLCAGRAAAAARHSRFAAGLAHRPPGPPRRRQDGRPARGGDRAHLPLRAAARRCPARRSHAPARAGTPGGRGAAASARRPARCRVHLQARPHPGGRLQLAAEEHAPAVPRADRAHDDRALRQRGRSAAGDRRQSLQRRRDRSRRGVVVAPCRAARSAARRLRRGHLALQERPGSAGESARLRPARADRAGPADRVRLCADSREGLGIDRDRRRLHPRRRAVRADRRGAAVVPRRLGPGCLPLRARRPAQSPRGGRPMPGAGPADRGRRQPDRGALSARHGGGGDRRVRGRAEPAGAQRTRSTGRASATCTRCSTGRIRRPRPCPGWRWTCGCWVTRTRRWRVRASPLRSCKACRIPSRLRAASRGWDSCTSTGASPSPRMDRWARPSHCAWSRASHTSGRWSRPSRPATWRSWAGSTRPRRCCARASSGCARSAPSC